MYEAEVTESIIKPIPGSVFRFIDPSRKMQRCCKMPNVTDAYHASLNVFYYCWHKLSSVPTEPCHRDLLC